MLTFVLILKYPSNSRLGFLKFVFNDFENNDMNKFEYELAFSRNLGWITTEEQAVLKSKKVAIAGCGGVGGHYCEVLTRLGIQNFHIADFDHFEVQNFNRQNQATITNLNKNKAEVLRDHILNINPNAHVQIFTEGVNLKNIDQFLSGVDLYLDGLDFFVLDLRELLFTKLAQKNIPAVTLAPVGMGVGFIAFSNKSMSFDNYFGFSKCKSQIEKAIHFLIGTSPHSFPRHYLVDPSRVDFKNQKAISTPMGVYLCASFAGTLTLKILLNRKTVKYAPWAYEVDEYLLKFKKTYLWFGFRNPFFQLKKYFIKKILKVA